MSRTVYLKNNTLTTTSNLSLVETSVYKYRATIPTDDVRKYSVKVSAGAHGYVAFRGSSPTSRVSLNWEHYFVNGGAITGSYFGGRPEQNYPGNSGSTAYVRPYPIKAVADSGYKFVGFFKEKTSENPHPTKEPKLASGATIPNDNYYIKSDDGFIIYFPQYTQSVSIVAVFGKRHTLKFDRNGSAGETTIIDYYLYTECDGYYCKIPHFTLVKDGYYFIGWNTKKDGSGIQFADGQYLTDSEILSASAGVLYAQWGRIDIRLTNSDTRLGRVFIGLDGDVVSEEDGEGLISCFLDPSKTYTLDYENLNQSVVTGAKLVVGDLEYSLPHQISGSSIVDGRIEYTINPIYSIVLSNDDSKGSVEVLTESAHDGKWLGGTEITFRVTAKIGHSPSSYNIKNENGDSLDSGSIDSTGVFRYEIDQNIVVSVSYEEVEATAHARVEKSSRFFGSASVGVSSEGGVATAVFTATPSDGDIFDFVGWYSEEGGAESVSTDNPYSISLESQTTLFARFSVKSDLPVNSIVSIRYGDGMNSSMGLFSIGGFRSTSGLIDYDVATGSLVSVYTSVSTGWAFGGWFTDSACTQLYSNSPNIQFFAHDIVLYARFVPSGGSVFNLEGSSENKMMTWESKTYSFPVPLNPSACRIDALNEDASVPYGYNPSVNNFKVEMFSSPYSLPTAVSEMTNIASQTSRRLPVRRMERYLKITIQNDHEVDAVFVGTSMEGLKT